LLVGRHFEERIVLAARPTACTCCIT